MMEEARAKDPQLFDLMGKAVEDGLSFVRQVESRGGYIGTYGSWPELSWLENGMPHLTTKTWDCPKDYGSVLRLGLRGLGLIGIKEEKVFDSSSRPSFVAVLEYVKSQRHLRARFVPDSANVPEDFGDSFVLRLPESAVDTYVHSYKEAPFSTEKFLPVYLPLETRLMEDRLPVDVYVPILFVKFDNDEFSLDSRTVIVRISDELHLARAKIHAYSPSVHEAVLGGATHALVLKSYEIPNSHLLAVSTLTSSASAYPVEKIDSVFAALRIVTGVDTGYAQLLLKPVDWTFGYDRNLPSLEGTSVRSYPGRFEDFYWNQEVPSVTNLQLSKIPAVLAKLMDPVNSPATAKLNLACRRLNRCYLREDEEDAVLDATIGMEVLLSDDGRQEITHKLALRVAALSALADGFNEEPVMVFRNVKHIYSFRSAVVHGDTAKVKKEREIKLEEKKVVPIVKVATKYLRMALQVLVQNPQYLKPAAIDEELLLRAPSLDASD